MHTPQSLEADAECQHILNVSKQLVSPQSNKPIIGLVQDSVIGSHLLTQKDTFLRHTRVMDLSMHCVYRTKPIPRPAIRYRDPGTGEWHSYWTGKQVYSMIIPHINLNKLVRDTDVFDPMDPGEGCVIIRRGELLCGSLCKGTIGRSSGGIVHVICNDLDNEHAHRFLSDAQRLTCEFMFHSGFSIGIKDVVGNPETDQAVHEVITTAFSKIESISEEDNIDPAVLEQRIRTVLQNVTTETGSLVVERLSPDNNIGKLVSSGSKGSNINISQILACVGQNSVNGKRILPSHPGGRTMPSYRAEDMNPIANGFCPNAYKDGLTPQEFWAHQTAGREGLVDTAVKTAYTGYIQRRLMKLLESLRVCYDGTVRDSAGHIIINKYGGDGISPRYIEKISIPQIMMSDMQILQSFHVVGSDVGLEQAQRMIALRDELRRVKLTFTSMIDKVVYVPINMQRIIINNENPEDLPDEELTAEEIDEELLSLDGYICKIFGEVESVNIRAATLSFLHAAQIKARGIGKTHLRRITKNIRKWLMRSLEEPGTAVGPIGAQSIGEPCTQMTLNTFHYAGVAAKNVTLGVPRFKELIDTSTRIKTPMATVRLANNMGAYEHLVDGIGKSFEHLVLDQVVNRVTIMDDPDITTSTIRADREMIQIHRMMWNGLQFSADTVYSRFVIRFSVSREKCLGNVITIRDVAQAMTIYYGDHAEIIASEVNNLDWTVRVRPINIHKKFSAAHSHASAEERIVLERMAVMHTKHHLLHKIFVKGISGIDRAFVRKETQHVVQPDGSCIKQSEYVIDTAGTNLCTLMSIEGVDSTRVMSNDIHEIYKTLGLEAARSVLYKEMTAVLQFDG